MDDYFSCDDFVIHSYNKITDTKEEAIEIILPYHFKDYTKEQPE